MSAPLHESALMAIPTSTPAANTFVPPSACSLLPNYKTAQYVNNVACSNHRAKISAIESSARRDKPAGQGAGRPAPQQQDSDALRASSRLRYESLKPQSLEHPFLFRFDRAASGGSGRRCLTSIHALPSVNQHTPLHCESLGSNEWALVALRRLPFA